MQIPFARADADKVKSLVEGNEISTLPALVFYNRRKAVVYEGYHAVEPVVEFIQKQIGEPVRQLRSVADVDSFVDLRSSRRYALSTVHVVRFLCRNLIELSIYAAS